MITTMMMMRAGEVLRTEKKNSWPLLTLGARRIRNKVIKKKNKSDGRACL